MVHFVGDQTQVSCQYESGTYATASGASFWPGMVQSNELSESEGNIPVRYAGGADRNVDQFVKGPTEFGGTMEFFPQDFRMFKFALGMNADAGSPSPFTHTYTEANSDDVIVETSGATTLPTFTLEDAEKFQISGLNLVRTAAGCMLNSYSLTASEGEPITCSAEYSAKTITYSSGVSATVTALTTRPFMWSDTKLQIPSGTTVTNLKEFVFTVSNNLELPNYVDNTRNIGVPIPTNRDYEVSLTLNADSSNTKTLYDSYFRAGSTFNMIATLEASAGSRVLNVTMSGCRLHPMSAPTPNEGVIEHSVTILPQAVTAIEDSLVQYYNGGSYA